MTTRTVQIKIDPSGAVSGAKVVKRSLDDVAKANISVERATKKSKDQFGRFSSSAVSASASCASLATANRQVAKTMQQTAVSTRTASNDLKAFISIAAVMAAFKPSFSLLDSLAEVSTLVDTATFDMERIRSGAISMSREFGGSAASQTKAYYQIISAGASDAAGATTLLTAANKLSIGGVTSVLNSTDGLTSTLNAYGLAADQATNVSDSMFVAMREGKTTIGELSSGIGKVAPLSSALGVSVDELLGSISALTKGGINTRESFTGMRAIMAAVIKPSGEAAKLAKALGIEFSTAGIKAKGLTGFLEDLKEKTGGSEDALAILFGGVEAIVPALALAGQAGLDYNKIMGEMAEKAGQTEKALEKMRKSPGFQAGRMWSALQAEVLGLTLSITEQLVPAMAFAADNMGSIVAVVGTLVAAQVAGKVATIALGFYKLAKAVGVARVALMFFGGPLGAILTVAGGAYVLFNKIVARNAIVMGVSEGVINDNAKALDKAKTASLGFTEALVKSLEIQRVTSISSGKIAMVQLEAAQGRLAKVRAASVDLGFEKNKIVTAAMASMARVEAEKLDIVNEKLQTTLTLNNQIFEAKRIMKKYGSGVIDDETSISKPRDISGILASVKNNSKTKTAYANAVRSITEATNALQSETTVVGLNEFAKARAAKTQELLNAANRDGKLVTFGLTGEISKLASEYANAASKLDVMEKVQEKAKERMNFARDTTKGIVNDFRAAREAGENFWLSIASSAEKAIDKITNRLLDQLLDAIFQVNNAGSGNGGGMFGNLLGSIFGGGAPTSLTTTSSFSTLLPGVYHNGGVIGAANDNTRLMPASSFANASKMHNGNLRADERPIIAQTGELMLSRRDVAEARNAGTNDSMGGGSKIVNINVNVTGAKGNQEVQDMVRSGVQQGLEKYSRSEGPVMARAALARGKRYAV